MPLQDEPDMILAPVRVPVPAVKLWLFVLVVVQPNVRVLPEVRNMLHELAGPDAPEL